MMPWVAVHLINGKMQPLERFPFVLGSSPDVDFQCLGEGVPEQAIWIQPKGKGIQFDFHAGQGSSTNCLLNGQAMVSGAILPPSTENLLLLGYNPILLIHVKDVDAWMHQNSPPQFSLRSPSGAQYGPCSSQELNAQLEAIGSD